MGSSNWSDAFYHDKVKAKKATGRAVFSHHADVTSGRAKSALHDTLNIHNKIRESRDSDVHPESNAIAVVFDETGSMGGVPRVMQTKLPKLMGLLLRKGYIEHPQVCMAAVGDAYSDRVPIQVGQFESGAEMDDDITNIYLEGNGGGQQTESYELMAYFFAHRTSIDCFEKRGKRGYMFIIGDEMNKDKAARDLITKHIHDGAERDFTTEEIYEALKEKYNVFYLLPKGTSYFNDPKIEAHWKALLGPENFIKVEDPDNICETIGMIIGLCEGTATADGMFGDLKDIGADDAVATAVASDLDAYANSVALMKVGEGGSLPEATGRSSDVGRL